MRHDTSTTADARVQVWSLWIDRAHHHRLVEVIHIPDEDHVRLRPVRDSRQQPPSYLEAAAQLAQHLRAGAAMTVETTPQSEERAARQRVRAIQRARAAKAKADARRRAAVIGEELARPRAKECRCPITPDSTLEDLLALGAGCTAGRWVCPTLDAIRRRLGR